MSSLDQLKRLLPRARRLSLQRGLTAWFLAVLLITSVAGSGGFLTSNAVTNGQQTDQWKIRMDDAIHVEKTASPAKGEPFPSESRSAQALLVAGVSTAAVPKSGGGVDKYIVLNVEFTSAATRMGFRQRGATVFATFD